MMGLIKSLIFLSVGEADNVENKVMIFALANICAKWFTKTNLFIDRQLKSPLGNYN